MILFLIAIYYRVFDPDSDVRSRPHQSAPRACFGARTVVILHMGKTAPEAASEVFQSFHRKNFRRGFLLSPDNSEVYLCPTNCVLSDKGPRYARPDVAFPSHATLTTNRRENWKLSALRFGILQNKLRNGWNDFCDIRSVIGNNKSANKNIWSLCKRP